MNSSCIQIAPNSCLVFDIRVNVNLRFQLGLSLRRPKSMYHFEAFYPERGDLIQNTNVTTSISTVDLVHNPNWKTSICTGNLVQNPNGETSVGTSDLIQNPNGNRSIGTGDFIQNACRKWNMCFVDLFQNPSWKISICTDNLVHNPKWEGKQRYSRSFPESQNGNTSIGTGDLGQTSNEKTCMCIHWRRFLM